jgi:glycine cleavage system transcriptional repressor
MSPLFAVTVIGRDRPGIVADVSGRLLDLGCNLEDVVTSLLSGHFALMLVCSAPAGVGLGRVQSALTGLSGDLHAKVWDVDAQAERPRPSHVLVAYGPDQLGIVHRVACVLAGRGVNISDMTCRLSSASLYAVTVEIELPEGLEVEELEVSLREALSPMGLELTLAPIESEVL